MQKANLKALQVKLDKYFLPLVLIIFFLVCVANVASAALWRDEAFSAVMAAKSIPDLLATTALDNSPPLHLLLLKFTTAIFGDSETVLRSWSIIGGLLTLYFSYKLALLYFKDKNLARYVLILVAASPLILNYSLEARAYILLVACSVAAAYFASLYLIKATIARFITLLLICSAGIYLHNLFFVMLFCIFLYMGVERIKSGYKSGIKTLLVQNLDLVYLALGLLLIYLPWLAVLRNQINTLSTQGFWVNFDPARDLFVVMGLSILGETNIIYQYGSLLPLFFLIAFIVIASFFKGWWYELDQIKTKGPLLTFTTFLPMILIYLVSFKIPLLYIRYVIFVVPFCYMVMVLAWQKYSKILLGLLVVLIVISTYNLSVLPINKENYPALISKIDFQPQTDVVFLSNALPIFGMRHYSNLPVYINTNPDDIRQYEGKAFLHDSDYWHGDLSRIERIWIPYIGDSGIKDFKKKLTDAGFHEVSTVKISDSFYLSLLTR